MEPGFETGPIKKQERDQSRPLKSAMSRSRGRSEASDNEDASEDERESENAKESRKSRGADKPRKNAWLESDTFKEV